MIFGNFDLKLHTLKCIRIELVYANWSDFYVGGVSIGKCDLRLLVKIGDKIRCQIHEMSAAEKRKLKKQIGSSSMTTTHNATLIYIGSDKRPKSGNSISFFKKFRCDRAFGVKVGGKDRIFQDKSFSFH